MILQEIKHWRKNHLLPDHYCDFLYNLYTEGSEYSSKTRFNWDLRKLFMLVVTIFPTLILFLVIYFSDFFNQMQTSISTIFIIFLIIGFVLGIIFRLFILQCLSLFICVIVIAWKSINFYEHHFSWLLFEGSWDAVAVFFILTAWMIQRINPKLSLSLYINGVVILFTPAILGIILPQIDAEILQLVLIIKLTLYVLSLLMWHAFYLSLIHI